ncbi:MAG: amidohydrolase [Acidimicrobiales bacterium]
MSQHSALSDRITQEADRHYARAEAASHAIHGRPELAFEERFASDLLRKELSGLGFEVKASQAALDTAFVATAGSGDLEIAICAEYDALPGVGHACGHNIIASAALLAAASIKPLLDDLGVQLRVLGTPAEEGGGGKVLMLEAGDFTGLHAAMMIHPSPADADRMPCVAAKHLDVSYQGKEAHAAGFPQLGVNALDAMTIAQVAIGMARQYIYPYDQVHGIVTKGGDAPNVIPGHVEGKFIVRSLSLRDLDLLEPKIRRCFEAGAVASGAHLVIDEPSPPYSEFIDDEEIVDLFREAAATIGRPAPRADNALRASTDMANISLEVPSIHPLLSIDSLPAVNHQPEFTRAAASPAADRAMRDGAVAMAGTILAIATNDSLRARLLNHRCR